MKFENLKVGQLFSFNIHIYNSYDIWKIVEIHNLEFKAKVIITDSGLFNLNEVAIYDIDDLPRLDFNLKNITKLLAKHL